MIYSEIFAKHIKDLIKFSSPSPFAVKRYLPKTTVLILSPHPDDEILMSGLALRLQNENGCKVINVAVTVGSDQKRKQARRQELKKAIAFLKWKNIFLSDDWKKKEHELKKIIQTVKPTIIIAPHINDWHPTHIKTAAILKKSIGKADCFVAWAEYWKPQNNPNFLVELTQDITLKQIQALEFHKGEIARNPYHVSLFGWQMDNVRRGSEWLAKKGSHSANMLAGQLYRLEKNVNGKLKSIKISKPFAKDHHDLTDWLSN